MSTREESVEIDLIIVCPGWRRKNDAAVEEIAKSMATVGLLQAIGLTDNYHLIYGRHRLEAAKKLGWKKIRARIYAGTSVDECRLMTLNENLCRHALDAVDYAKAMAECKRLYLKVHPASTAAIMAACGSHGSATIAQPCPPDSPPSCDTLLSSADSGSPRGFAENIAALTGQSKRTVEGNVAIGEEILDDVAQDIIEADVKSTKVEAAQLAKLPPEKQREVAAKVKIGEAKTLGEALGRPPRKPPRPPKDQVDHFHEVAWRLAAVKTALNDLGEAHPGPDYKLAMDHLDQADAILTRWRKQEEALAAA